MTDAVKTLLLPFREGGLDFAPRALFLNAEWSEALPSRPFAAQQFSAPLADALLARGVDARPELPDEDFDLVLLHAPKQREEMLWYIAESYARLAPGGIFVCAAANDAGGNRLADALRELGREPATLSKHHARVAWARGAISSAANRDILDEWRAGGEPRKNPVGFISQPGLFAWDRIDAGSALLMRHIPAELAGDGADFGCGYGALAAHVLKACPLISSLTCIDADARAVDCCRRNAASPLTQFMWEDLRKKPARLAPLDFIVMNPPFHEGKKTLPETGQAFIRTAARSLKPGGALYMVANSHLPYEQALAASFRNVTPLAAENGFKVLHATGRL
jgi:16S rRNA (guanine1207-N2)-methyltransferase